MLLSLIVLPLCGALLSWVITSDRLRRALLLAIALTELCMAASCWVWQPTPMAGEVLTLDPIGRVVLTITCLLFFAASLYAVAYLKKEIQGTRPDFFQKRLFSNAPEATFIACLLIFLSAAVTTASTRHFALLWVGIETTTLASAPLIYFHRHKRSLEATWKYLLICSVGIALALIGNFLLDISLQTESNQTTGMTVLSYTQLAPSMHVGWFKAAFVFLLIGYGTKAGIAPMHTWLPDAHSEAPSLISALLSGALLNCAFLGIFRTYEVSVAAGLGEFSASLLMAFGMLSLVTAALFIVGQKDFKRMLAYSSVEHMGILLIGLGVSFSLLASGDQANSLMARSWLMHMVCHSLIKAGLFLIAGNILATYRTKSCLEVTGLGKVLPLSGSLWLMGIIAITGSPPFGLFVSEFSLITGILSLGKWQLALALTLALGVIFIGMITPALHMYKGSAPSGMKTGQREPLGLVGPSALLLACALLLGLYTPSWLTTTFDSILAMVTP